MLSPSRLPGASVVDIFPVETRPGFENFDLILSLIDDFRYFSCTAFSFVLNERYDDDVVLWLVELFD